MSLESDFILSFYKEVSVVDERHQVVLVQHIETKKFYVKKTVSLRSRDIYTALKDGGRESVRRPSPPLPVASDRSLCSH